MTPAGHADTVVSAMAKIFSVPARLVLSHVVNPIARFLLRSGV